LINRLLLLKYIYENILVKTLSAVGFVFTAERKKDEKIPAAALDSRYARQYIIATSRPGD